jgi:hypothetical protein
MSGADYVNLLGDNKDTNKKNTETLNDASAEVELEINVQKIKCMLLTCHQDAGQNWDIRSANSFFKMCHN